MRKSPPTIDAEYKAMKKEQLKRLEEAHDRGFIHLMYMDEAGVDGRANLNSTWTKKGEQKRIEQPKSFAERVSIVGAWERDKEFQYGLYTGSFNSVRYVQFMDSCAKQAKQNFNKTGKLSMMVQDNCSIHKSKEVRKHWKRWQKQGLYMFFLPTYSPELNPIELQWRHLKYTDRRGKSFKTCIDLLAWLIVALEQRFESQGCAVDKVTIN
jgi:putative transposase